MNLQEFINYRTNCLVCDEQLTTNFNSLSKRRQIVRQDENRMTFVSNLASFNYRGGGFESNSVGYSVGLKDLSLWIEFYQNSGENVIMYDVVSFDLLKKFEVLHANLHSFSVFRGCLKCSSYEYSSQSFNLPLRCDVLPDLMVSYERIDLAHYVQPYRRRYRLFNSYSVQASYFYLWKDDVSDNSDTSLYKSVPSNATALTLPIFPFSSAQEMIERLNGLIVFS